MKPTFLILILLSCITCSCQSITINGLVINEDGDPVPNATITIKPSNQSFITNANGQFTIHYSPLTTHDTLIISATGYEPQSLTIDHSPLTIERPFTITLKRSSLSLEEVVLNTGYSYVPKERATGAFENVNNQLLNKQVSTGILDRLKGTTAAVAFDNVPTHPAITVRGLSSIGGPKDPLIVLDNFPYEGSIANINPNDIESITVLKDAAAASIWGTRAGNGVIVITTKKAKLRRPLSIELNMNWSVAGRPDLLSLKTISTGDFIDVEQFLYNNGYYNAQVSNASRPALSPVVEILLKKTAGQLTSAQADAQINELRSIDFRKEMLQYMYTPSFNQQYALTVRSGAERSAFIASAGYDKNSSDLDALYSRFTFHLENRFMLTKKFSVTTSLNLNKSVSKNGRSAYDLFSTAANFYPYIKLSDANGNALPSMKTLRQPYKDTAGAGRLLDWNYYPLDDYRHTPASVDLQEVIAKASLQYDIMNGLQCIVTYQYQLQQVNTVKLQDEQSYFVRDLVNRFTQINRSNGTVTYAVPKAGILDKAYDAVETHNARAQLNYSAVWNSSSITMLAGAEVRQYHSWQNAYRLYGYNDNTLSFANVDYVNAYPTFITGAASFIPNNTIATDKTNRFVSLFANGAYTFKSRYMLSVSARRDASNLFGVSTNDKWNPLWSAGAGWILSKENFSPAFLSYLKLRFTYGFSGNVDQSKTAVTTIRYIGTAAYINTPYAVVAQFENPALRWEKIKMINAAIDFEIKGGALSGSIDFYTKKGTDLFGAAPVDYTIGTGALSLIMNVAGMKGKGIDLVLHSKNINKRFRWFTDLLIGYNKTEITKYYLSSQSASNYLNNGNTISALQGQPVYSVISYAWAGLDSLGNPLGYLNGQPSKDYAAIQGTGTRISDLVYSGSAIPVWAGSFINTFSWKGLSVSVNIAYKFDYYFRRRSVNYTSLFTLADGHADFAKRWQQKGDENNTYVPSMVYPNVTNRNNFYANSSVLVTRADHIRLQYINISYDFSGNWMKTIGTNSWQCYAVISNIGIVWKANQQGIDPEYPNSYSPPLSVALGCRFGF